MIERAEVECLVYSATGVVWFLNEWVGVIQNFFTPNNPHRMVCSETYGDILKKTKTSPVIL